MYKGYWYFIDTFIITFHRYSLKRTLLLSCLFKKIVSFRDISNVIMARKLSNRIFITYRLVKQ